MTRCQETSSSGAALVPQDKWSAAVAELRASLEYLKARMPCADGACCAEVRARIAAIEEILK